MKRRTSIAVLIVLAGIAGSAALRKLREDFPAHRPIADGVPSSNRDESTDGKPAPTHLPPSPDSDGNELLTEEGVPHPTRWRRIEDFETPLATFDTVFWEPQDTTSLRKLIRETPLVKGKTILEIGTGSGLISLCCLKAGALRVVATDINPAAVECALFNAERLQLKNRLETAW